MKSISVGTFAVSITLLALTIVIGRPYFSRNISMIALSHCFSIHSSDTWDCSDLFSRVDDSGGLRRVLEYLSETPSGNPSAESSGVFQSLTLYEYEKSVLDERNGRWASSVAHLQKAMVYGWGQVPASVYAQYLTAERQLNIERQVSERAENVTVGDKSAASWDAPTPLGTKSLAAVSVLDWPAFADGQPSTVNFTWLTDRGSISEVGRRTNMVPNGAFALGGSQDASQVLGWHAAAPGIGVTQGCGSSDKPEMECLELYGLENNGTSSLQSTVIPLHGGPLVWTAWVESPDGGSADIVVDWLGPEANDLLQDPIFQNNMIGLSRSYAGVLMPPVGAQFVRLELFNWKASRTVAFSRLALFDVDPN